VFDHNGDPLAVAQKEITQHYPRQGWVEHDPREIWSTQAGVVAEVLTQAGLSGSNIAAAGITNQRETTIMWNRKTGKPVYNAIVWQDRRTAGYCDRLRSEGLGDIIQRKTGLIIDAYFSASKIRWILDNVKEAGKLAAEGEQAFGTVDSWLVWNMSHGRLHLTDATNASRTMLFNIHSLEWDKELLDIFGIPPSVLPEVRPTSSVFCETDSLFPGSMPVAGIAGDQQAALFGQMCISPGMIKNTYGTGCFMVMNTGSKPIRSSNRLLTTVAWKTGNEVVYALEGSIFIAGAVVQWLRDGLGIIRKSADVEKLASSVSDSGGVYFVPAFAGLGAPHWNQDARGTIVGLTRGSTSSHIARAALDSIAYQSLEVLDAMRRDSDISISEIRVDGGASVNNRLMQFQADLLQTAVVRPGITETTALGAAYFAGLATGFWESTDEIKRHWHMEKKFTPSIRHEDAAAMIRGWRRAVNAAKAWADNVTR
jgi:glycerol kinase